MRQAADSVFIGGKWEDKLEKCLGNVRMKFKLTFFDFFRRPQIPHKRLVMKKCRWPDSNRQGMLSQQILSLLCLPFHHSGVG